MELTGLREARHRRLLTQVELANLVGMTTATISRIETGATKARISTVRKIAKALEIDPAELTGVNGFTEYSKERGDE
ncbi:MAG: helix-turn-helix domain-containing protein [Thermomicrobiales bacterium]